MMKPQTRSSVKEFERKLRETRHEVWRTVVRTEEELATLEAHQAGEPIEDAGTAGVAAVLSRLDGAQRHLLDEIDAAQARLAAGTFGACARCGQIDPAGAAACAADRAALYRVRARRACLSKQRDRYASKDDITRSAPRSVVSRRTLARIAADRGGDVKKAATGDPPKTPRRS